MKSKRGGEHSKVPYTQLVPSNELRARVKSPKFAHEIRTREQEAASSKTSGKVRPIMLPI